MNRHIEMGAAQSCRTIIADDFDSKQGMMFIH